MAVSIKIDDLPVSVLANTLSIKKTINLRSTADFSLRDLAGTANYQPGMKVEITDSVDGLEFSGYIDNVSKLNLYPKAANIWTVECIGPEYLADKRYFAGVDFRNRFSGDIASSVLQSLKNEGIKGDYVYDETTTGADFSNGVLVNTEINNDIGYGALQLKRAGTTISQEYFPDDTTLTSSTVEKTTQEVTLKNFNALKMQARCAVERSGDRFARARVWKGDYTIVAGDIFEYEIWISTDNPSFECGVDVVFGDLTTYSNSSDRDSEGVLVSTKTNIESYAAGKWYKRSFGIQDFHDGKHIIAFYLVIDGDQVGDYSAYFRNIKIVNGVTVKIDVFNDASTAIQTPLIKVKNSGYADILVSIVNAYEKTGSFFTPGFSTTSAGIYRSSFLHWEEEIPIEGCIITSTTSVDGGGGHPFKVFMDQQNNAPLPGFHPGQTLVSQAVVSFFFLTNNSPTPEFTPVWKSVKYNIEPSFHTNNPKTDFILKLKTFSDYTDNGVLSNLSVVGNELFIPGARTSWDGEFPDHQNTTNGFMDFGLRERALYITTEAGSEAKHRLDFAGQWQNFLLEIDLLIHSDYETGIFYRTTGFGSGKDTYAYGVQLTPTVFRFVRGNNSNNSANNTAVVIQSVTHTLESDAWYSLKVEVNGNLHKFYIDDVEVMSVTNSQFSGTGFVGIRMFTPTSTNETPALYDNFGIVAATKGTWTSNAINISSVGTILDSYTRTHTEGAIGESDVFAEVSLNNGGTWARCGRDTTMPGLGPGVNTATLTQVRFRIIIDLSSPAAYVETHGSVFYVLSSFESTGTRTSNPIQLSSLDRASSASVSWNGSEPAGTELKIETSLDQVIWTEEGTGASGSEHISSFTAQTEPFYESFSEDTSDNYSSENATGGSLASWTHNMAQSKLSVSGGSHALYRLLDFSIQDGYIIIDTNKSELSGAFLCYQTSPTVNFYTCEINDSASALDSNTLKLFKYTGATRTQLGSSIAIDLARGGNVRRFKFTQENGKLFVEIDGEQITMYDDSATSPFTQGSVGLYCNAGQADFFNLFAQGFGDRIDASNDQLFTRITLNSTNPLETPVVEDLVVSVRGNTIIDGAIIPSANYSVFSENNTCAAIFDDIASQSNASWWLDQNQQFYLQRMTATPAPFVCNAKNILLEGISFDLAQELYRNSQWLENCFELIHQTETFISDGDTRSWTLTYLAHSITKITFDGNPVLFAASGVAGKEYYFTPGEKEIILADGAAAPIAGKKLVVEYAGRRYILINIPDEQAISSRALLDQSSGIVELKEDAGGITKEAAFALALSKLEQFAHIGNTLQFQTRRKSLAPGQLLHVFLNAYKLFDIAFLITDISVLWRKTRTQSGVENLPFYTVTAVDGPVVGDWTQFFVKLHKK